MAALIVSGVLVLFIQLVGKCLVGSPTCSPFIAWQSKNHGGMETERLGFLIWYFLSGCRPWVIVRWSMYQCPDTVPRTLHVFVHLYYQTGWGRILSYPLLLASELMITHYYEKLVTYPGPQHHVSGCEPRRPECPPWTTTSSQLIPGCFEFVHP